MQDIGVHLLGLGFLPAALSGLYFLDESLWEFSASVDMWASFLN